MTPQLLLQHFDRIGEAPEAIPRLRRFILDLAVRGKLVEQDQRDEPAFELLERIETENRQVQDPSDPFTEDEQPFKIPHSWAWIRIRNAAHVEMGQSPPSENYNKSGNGIPFYQGKTDFGIRHPTPRYWCNLPSKLAQKNDILISVRAPVGPTNIASEECCIGRGLAALRPRHGVYLEFLLYSLKGFETAIAAIGYGTTFVAITKKQLLSFAIPLPPLAEQYRIVAKVDELMALCDRLEAAQTERESRRDRLVASSLHHLNNGANADAFREHARFYFNHLPRLTTHPDHIKQLRQTILNLAVRGKLVKQDPTDEPASELLKRIQAERTQLEKAGESKVQKQHCVGKEIGKPFNIPKTWLWISLGDIAFGFRYGTSVKCSFERTEHPVLRIPNVDNGRVNIEDLKFGALSAREAADLQLQLGDILMVRSNGSLNLVGRPALIEAHAVGFCYAGYLVRVRTSVIHIDSPYLLLALNTTHIRDQIEIPIRSTVGLKNVNATELSRLLLPLPPLAEQHRIVAKVDELMALCDQLETQLTTTQSESHRLLDAILHDTLAGST